MSGALEIGSRAPESATTGALDTNRQLNLLDILEYDKSWSKSKNNTSDSPLLPKLEFYDSGSHYGNYGAARPEKEDAQSKAAPRYQGESIPIKTEPSYHTVKKGDSLEEIAAKHLGSGATGEQIQKHALEIAKLNYLDEWRPGGERSQTSSSPAFRLDPGQKLILPGHTESGDLVLKDSRGTRFTYGSDGTTRVDYKDGTGYTRTPEKQDGYSEHHFGPKEKDNFEVTVSKDGTARRSDQSRQQEPIDLEKQRCHLKDLADKMFDKGVLTRTERTQFEKDMSTFENRFQDLHKGSDEEKAEANAEIARTYKETSRILEAKGNHPLTDRKRVRAALSTMAVAAEPTSNDQGAHETCNVTVIENRIFTREPSVAAGLIADVATTGKYVAKDGTTVHLDAQSLKTHSEEAQNGPRGDGLRNYASQLFQVAAVNLLYTKENEQTVPPGNTRYSQERQTMEESGGRSDSGERVRNYSSDPPTKGSYQKGGYFDEMIEINKMITGRDEPEVFLAHKDSVGPLTGRVNQFSSKEEFEARLLQLKLDGKLPFVIGVHTDHKLFSQTGQDDGQSKVDTKKVLDDGHVVLITDYDPINGQIYYDNQWGNHHDRLCDPVDVDEMYKATTDVKASEWLDRVDQTRQRDHLRGAEEERYAKHLERIMSAYAVRWTNNNSGQAPPGILTDEQQEQVLSKWQHSRQTPVNVDEADQQLALRKYEAMLNHLSKARADLVVQNVRKKVLKDLDQAASANS